MIHRSNELLSWAVGVAAHPNDIIVALHVLVDKDEKKLEKSNLQRAKTSVINMLANYAKICQAKQVQLEAKVRTSSSISKGLIEEALLIEANFLLVGGGCSKNSSQRKSFEITNYCFKHAPEGCLVIAIGRQGMPQNQTDMACVTCEGNNNSVSSRWTGRDGNNLVKALFPLQKPLGSKLRKDDKCSGRHCLLEITDEKGSPRGVLEECSSHSSNEINGKHHNNNNNKFMNIWSRLSTTKLLFPFFCSSNRTEDDNRFSLSKDGLRPSWKCFKYDEISRATIDFHQDNIVGKGGFAEVYKGTLNNGKNVAIKRLAKGNNAGEHKEKMFLIELGILGHVFHPNTAYLVGCCIENGLYLIFDFYPNGSLSSALHGRNPNNLEWHLRYKIALGVARGLHYLHKCCRRRIIHRDIKASNVLLGPDFEPQISDFGLAKWLPKQWTHHSVLPIEGTFGYLAPEYFMHGIVDEKTDVFAYGVLLLEIITGRKPIDSSKQSLLLWAKPLITRGKIAQMADPNLKGKYDKDQLEKLVLVASYCVRQSAVWRPTMNEVLELLMDEEDIKCTKEEDEVMQA
ncbi:probable receptor-like serine/threonine-protein kinase At5g57670 isoform X2 [Dioscorea cayenensis subsp. rotundata]|uniref:Probable receptor-like serine/threonine-protein kinase At5g57670 isoform X2 n=1 Tax=Dioscorea cayennensis subsp. rotundata TaxID=55577 RepID=A0AB40CQ27_DIOCR|nr:probable receptor-like serine/threonine-protein kinase At5g57670 isoform X2 [Dioscorea cayenensis subsp. rotundata]